MDKKEKTAKQEEEIKVEGRSEEKAASEEQPKGQETPKHEEKEEESELQKIQQELAEQKDTRAEEHGDRHGRPGSERGRGTYLQQIHDHIGTEWRESHRNPRATAEHRLSRGHRRHPGSGRREERQDSGLRTDRIYAERQSDTSCQSSGGRINDKKGRKWRNVIITRC